MRGSDDKANGFTVFGTGGVGHRRQIQIIAHFSNHHIQSDNVYRGFIAMIWPNTLTM